MKLQALQRMRGDFLVGGRPATMVAKGDKFAAVTVDDERDLLTRGLAIMVGRKASTPRMEGAAAPLAAGQTGQGGQSSSSAAAPRQKTPAKSSAPVRKRRTRPPS